MLVTRLLDIIYTIQVCQFLEARPPFGEVVIVLIAPRAGRVKGAQGASVGASAFIIKHQQGVVWGGSGVTVCCNQVLIEAGKENEYYSTAMQVDNNAGWSGHKSHYYLNDVPKGNPIACQIRSFIPQAQFPLV